jgi:hypothetical protein
MDVILGATVLRNGVLGEKQLLGKFHWPLIFHVYVLRALPGFARYKCRIPFKCLVHTSSRYEMHPICLLYI